jgi:nucleoside 2-deoxyribosyltransferase
MTALNVFISSTCYDLADLRAELGDYLRKHAFLVAMSEDYESEFKVNANMDSVSTCLLNVERADVVVCILDRRYGPPLPAGHAHAGVSATHAELKHAAAQGKPVFAFVRDKSHSEHRQILGNAAFRPDWIDRGMKNELASLIKEQEDLMLAVGQKRSNWFDPFKNSVDLKPLVLKRLLDEFPHHVGAFARQPDRMVRLYYKHIGSNPQGPITGTFVNAGNGPAINVSCGWHSNGADTPWQTQGAVPVGGELAGTTAGAAVTFMCAPMANFALYCEYETASGDRFRVVAPMRSTQTGYKREGPEVFYTWIGNQWAKVA